MSKIWALWDSNFYILNFRGDAIDIAEMLAIIQIRAKPIVLEAIDAIVIHFGLEYIMIHNVEHLS